MTVSIWYQQHINNISIVIVIIAVVITVVAQILITSWNHHETHDEMMFNYVKHCHHEGTGPTIPDHPPSSAVIMTIISKGRTVSGVRRLPRHTHISPAIAIFVVLYSSIPAQDESASEMLIQVGVVRLFGKLRHVKPKPYTPPSFTLSGICFADLGS